MKTADELRPPLAALAASVAAPRLKARLTVDYPGGKSALEDAEIEAGAGEMVGVVGSSGCGKSTLALALMGLAEWRGARVRGSILWEGSEIAGLSQRDWNRLRGREMALILQSPSSALNPYLTIGRQMREAWRAHRPDEAGGEWDRVGELFERLALPAGDEFLKRRSGQISLGQAQRVLSAMALLHSPKLLIADEATSALDALSQSAMLHLIRDMNRDNGMTVLFISHDLGAVAALCSRVAICDEGRIVESGPVDEVLAHPRHPVTRLLVENTLLRRLGGPAGQVAAAEPREA